MLVRAFIWLSLLMLSINANAAAFDHSHQQWQQLLTQYVTDSKYASRVNYAEWKKQPQALRQYLASLSTVSQAQYKGWTKAQQLAFLINAYNAFTVQLILENYPVESIKDIGSFFRSAWKIEFFTLFGEKRYLDYIEHEVIRGSGRFNEPRIHFALVCASIGCPKLQTQAFTEHNLEALLELGANTFLADQSRNRYDAANKILYLSSIFKWYGEDFVAKFGSVANFVLPKMGIKSANPDIEIEYLDYNWQLNDNKL